MHRRRLLALSSALAVGSLAGCVGGGPGDGSGEPTTPAGPLPDVEDETLAAAIRGANGFTFDLFGRLSDVADEEGEPNLFASPFSVTTALAMTYAGARGTTREEMRAALRYDLGDGGEAEPPDEDLHASFGELLVRLNERGDDVDPDDLPSSYDEEDDPVPFELSIVNAVWGQEDYPFREPYLELLEQFYGAGLQEVDYVADAGGARETINEWVADRTGDRIEDLLPEGSLDEFTRLVLTNAVYFAANWAEPFEEGATRQAEFATIDGESVDVPTMRNGEVNLPYGEATLRAGDVQAVELPYVGEEVSMLVVLPAADAFESVADAFDGEDLRSVLDALERREGSVELPRFEFESGFALRPVLEALDMVEAFDPDGADFTGMYDAESASENLFVDDVYHDTYLAVDEKGTEAAAATGVVMSADSAPMDPFEFVANRPFLFAIRDRPTEAVLFVGRVGDPTAE